MSDELVKSLQGRLEALTTELGQLKAEAKDRRIKGKATREALEGRTRELEELRADRDAWKTKAEASNPELTARVEELTGQIRARDHRAAFDKAAAAQGLRPDAVDAAWRLSGYQPAEDSIDPEAIAAAVRDTAAVNPFLLATAATEAPATPATPATPAAPPAPKTDPLTGIIAGGRGPLDSAPGQMRITAREYGDPVWMDRNAAAVAAASKAGTLVVN